MAHTSSSWTCALLQRPAGSRRAKAPAATATSANGPTGPSKWLSRRWRSGGGASSYNAATSTGTLAGAAATPASSIGNGVVVLMGPTIRRCSRHVQNQRAKNCFDALQRHAMQRFISHRAKPACAAGCSGRRTLTSAETDRLDVVAIGVEQERGVVVRAVFAAQARLAVVATPVLQPLRVESRHRVAIAGNERQVRARADRAGMRIQP